MRCCSRPVYQPSRSLETHMTVAWQFEPLLPIPRRPLRGMSVTDCSCSGAVHQRQLTDRQLSLHCSPSDRPLQADRSHSCSASRAVAIARHQTLGRFSDGDEPSRAPLACANIELSQCEDQNGNGRYGQVVVNSLRVPAGTVDVCITLEDSGGRHADELSAHQGAGRIR